jgi:hypothetical protein
MTNEGKKIDDAITALFNVIQPEVSPVTLERMKTIMRLAYMKGIWDESVTQVGMKRLLESEDE